MMPRVLTVAGSDSGGGAGIQADLKTIALLGAFGMSAVTALTAQNTLGVKGIHEIPAHFVAEQMEAVLADIGADAMKTGMLGNSAVVRAVCRIARKYRLSKIVVDPVMAATRGGRLLSPAAGEALKNELLPLARVITPNLSEAEALIGRKVRGLKNMREAAVQIHRMGARNVLIKGGHLSGKPVDIFFDGRKLHELAAERIATPHTHGTGCTISAAIAVELARGNSALEAVQKAKAFITSAIQFSLDLGRGQGPVNPYASAAREIERYGVVQSLKAAFRELRGKRVGHLLPEVQSNLGYALPFARGIEDVAAFPGRFVRLGKEITKVADPEFGASQHIAKIILTAMAQDPEMRSAMNLRFTEEILTRVRKAGLAVGHFDRKREPAGVKKKEGSTLSWGVHQVLQGSKKIPDIIFDRGGVGKEPMVRVLGRDPGEVVSKVLSLL
jgi:hydroxymethylpyrimidine kinase / phosphomethylpyrimidine kinase / thiamine-phosphate diphosphorylase